MMPKIDFYIMSDPAVNTCLQQVCQLVEKAYQQTQPVYIHTNNQSDAKQLDSFLWTYRDDSFIPHNLYTEGSSLQPPIQIGFGLAPQDHRDILINLSDDVPNFYQQFSHILEVVSSDSKQQTLARERFRFYRDNACEIATYKL